MDGSVCEGSCMGISTVEFLFPVFLVGRVVEDVGKSVEGFEMPFLNCFAPLLLKGEGADESGLLEVCFL